MQVGGMKSLSGGSHMLASAVRMRIPSASSAPLKRALSAAPAAHPALDSPPCARDAARQLSCSSSANSPSETGFVVGGSERTKVTCVILSSRNALNISRDVDHSH